LAAFNVLAAEELSIKGKVDKDHLTTDEALTFTVTISGESRQAPGAKLPSLEEFDVLSRANSFSFSTAAGKATFANSMSLFLRPKKAGALTIGPVVVNYNGKEYKTEPIKVEVKQGTLPREKQKPVPVPANNNREELLI